jgi:pyrroline-5-carboxylate reductase
LAPGSGAAGVIPGDMVIGIIGTGNLGSALVKGWARAEDPPAGLILYDKDHARVAALRAAHAPLVEIADSLEEIAGRARVLVVAVKPQDIGGVLEELTILSGPGHTVVSTAAGAKLERLRCALGKGPALYRIMPNLAVALGKGVVALIPEEGSPPEEVELMKGLFQGLGTVESMPEALVDAATTVLAAAPAFLALVMEGLEEGAVRVGISRPMARRMLLQMFAGTASLLENGDMTFAELRERVSSPAGTTMAGLAVLEDRGTRGALLRAVEASTARGAEL